MGTMLWITIETLNIAAYLPFLAVDEEDISKNMRQLKKYHWFQILLNNDKYREQIIHNHKVRQTIGRMNTQKLYKKTYNAKCQNRLHSMLQTAGK